MLQKHNIRHTYPISWLLFDMYQITQVSASVTFVYQIYICLFQSKEV